VSTNREPGTFSKRNALPSSQGKKKFNGENEKKKKMPTKKSSVRGRPGGGGRNEIGGITEKKEKGVGWSLV